MQKYFFITIDTEGDNLWENKPSQVITTKNAQFIPRFQALCEKYNFIPTYLTNYEMAMDPYFIDFAKDKLKRNLCEIGMHLHAWNSPPLYKDINSLVNFTYLIHYPEKIMESKIEYMTNILEEKFERKIYVHRAGRWAINQKYFDILINNGYIADCSVSPHINWSSDGGSDYTNANEKSYCIKSSIYKDKRIVEIPVSIRKARTFSGDGIGLRQMAKAIKYSLVKKNCWIRPKTGNKKEMLTALNTLIKEDNEYAMFMLHSSELMPGGSPNFKTKEDIEKLYENIEFIFNKASALFKGYTLEQFAQDKLKNSNQPLSI